jgi:hypothetical protein
MDSATATLRERIEAFELDEPGAKLPYTSRLAREQAWTHAYAARVVREYKRFLILAMEVGHPVSPSEDVDQAWHLHLVYTRSYWQRLCRETLGQDLHHEPTTGGSAESTKFDDWYARTLESYRRIFNEEPPRDIWPAAEDRSHAVSHTRWIDASRFWLIPRPAWLRRGVRKPSSPQ